MSDIPKSKRAYSNLEAHHKALEIRRKIAVELLASFAYSEKKLEEAVRKQTQHIQDPEHRAEAAQTIRNLEEDFACWFKERPSFQRKLVNANQDAPGHDRWGYRVVFI